MLAFYLITNWLFVYGSINSQSLHDLYPYERCYNPVKSFQIASSGAWFSQDHVITWDSGEEGGTQWSGRIIGVAEYDINSDNYPIVVKLLTASTRHLYIGFNRAVGPTSENQQASDQVTITEGGDGFNYAQTYLQAALLAGKKMSIPNWRGSGLALRVVVNEINTWKQPGYADITLTFGPQPSKNPTA